MAAADRRVGPIPADDRRKQDNTANTVKNKKSKTGSDAADRSRDCALSDAEKRKLREQMIGGYREMADINLKISEEFYAAEQELWFAE